MSSPHSKPDSPLGAWRRAGCPLPGPDAHAPFMPYGRTSAAEARASGRPGEDFREAAVLIGVEPDGRIALIERAPGGGVHGGQMALPGGALEPGETLLQCALREWREELGLSAVVEPLSEPVALTEVHVMPSRFIVRPHVAAVRLAEVLDFDVTEVAAVHRLRIEDLLDQAFQLTQRVRVGGQSGFTIEAPGFDFPDMPFIWGATAMMLGELRAILSVHGG